VKQRILYSSIALIFLLGLFFFGKTSVPKPPQADEQVQSIPVFDPLAVIDSITNTLSPSQQMQIQKLKNNMSQGDMEKQQAEQYGELAEFWKDSAAAFVPYAYYLSQAAKLDNSEKKLTFAAQFILENMRRESRADLKLWEAQTAAGLFEQALKLNPSNPDLKIGLGSCYVYGEGMIGVGDPQKIVRGIQALMEVVQKDSNNMKAQMVLGIASVISNQTDKGINRLTKVVDFDPHNLEAVSWLADAYADKGDVANAKKWYEQSKHIVNNPAFSAEVDKRIKALEQQ